MSRVTQAPHHKWTSKLPLATKLEVGRRKGWEGAIYVREEAAFLQ